MTVAPHVWRALCFVIRFPEAYYGEGVGVDRWRVTLRFWQ